MPVDLKVWFPDQPQHRHLGMMDLIPDQRGQKLWGQGPELYILTSLLVILVHANV